MQDHLPKAQIWYGAGLKGAHCDQHMHVVTVALEQGNLETVTAEVQSLA